MECFEFFNIMAALCHLTLQNIRPFHQIVVLTDLFLQLGKAVLGQLLRRQHAQK